jgi:hypothetical protein
MVQIDMGVGLGIAPRLAVKLYLALAALFASTLTAQDKPGNRFAGTWEAKFNGTVFVVLKIHTNGEITGSMTNFNLNVDEDGNISGAEAQAGESPIQKTKAQDDSLTFEWNADPSEPALKFELKATGTQEAQLKVLDTGDTKIKPFNMTKRT